MKISVKDKTLRIFFKAGFLISLSYISHPKSSVNLSDRMFRKAYVGNSLHTFFDVKNLSCFWSHS